MCKSKIPVRFWIAVMMFLTTYINYTTLVNMSISIVSMTTGMKNVVPECLKAKHQKHVLQNNGPRYDWDEQIQAQILGSFFWGHMFSSAIGGTLAEFCGAFHVILWSNVCCGLFNTLTVFAAEWNYLALCVCRFIVGVFQGTVYPALQTLIARWAPPDEKGRFIGCLMGNTLATAITWPVLGTVTAKCGWKWGFYMVSIEILIYCVLFYIICSDSPDDHKFITAEEREFIKLSQGHTVTKNKHFPPIYDMLTNLPFWILNIGFFGNMWGLFLQLESVPKFIAEVVGIDLNEAGILVALPHIARLFTGTGFGFLGDYLETREISNNAIRKSFTICSHIIPGIFLIALAFCGCDIISIVAMLTLSMGFNGAATITCMQNPQDLAPNFAGTMYGIMHLISGAAGFIAPEIIGVTIKDNNGVKEWGYNFILGGILYILSGVIFMLFGSVEEQHWNRIADEEGVVAAR